MKKQKGENTITRDSEAERKQFALSERHMQVTAGTCFTFIVGIISAGISIIYMKLANKRA